MVGKTMVSYLQGREELSFADGEGNVYKFYHEQDCCESVAIEEVSGELSDLIGSPILLAETSSKTSTDDDEADDFSSTWTFYTFRTHKGTVQVRWLGTSNGYYSEKVSFSASGPSF